MVTRMNVNVDSRSSIEDLFRSGLPVTRLNTTVVGSIPASTNLFKELEE